MPALTSRPMTLASLLGLVVSGIVATTPAAIAQGRNAERSPKVGRQPPGGDRHEAYLFVYFTGDSIDGEKIRFAVSEGNNALQWQELNGGHPVLESALGTRGLRDPFILRSPKGDRFFLLATDLSVGRTDWNGATDRGSQYLEVWESTDLVHWGAQRHIRVNLPNAGMTWAPEASWDPAINAYVVYWTSTLFKDGARTSGDGEGPQILRSTTSDFRTFTTPEPWLKAADVPGMVRDKGLIDTTILADQGYYYRFTKGTDAAGCASGDIFVQRSQSLRAMPKAGGWSLIDRCIGRRAGTPEVEGPSAFKANAGDVGGFRYYLWVDHYGGIGYIPLGTNSLTPPIRWTYPSAFRLPRSPRHGAVLPITKRERAALVARWGVSAQPKPVPPRIDDTLVVPPIVASGTRLPMLAGHDVRWQVDGMPLTDGVLRNDGAEPRSVRLTATTSRAGMAAATKAFGVTILGPSAQRLTSYARTPTSADDANQPVIARSVHLALGPEGRATPLNGDYGVAFARGDYIGVDRVDLRGVADPFPFYFADGSLGIIAIRVDMAGRADPGVALIFKTAGRDAVEFRELGVIDLHGDHVVSSPRAVWDSAAGRYNVTWKDGTGLPYRTTVTDLARTELAGGAFEPTPGALRSRIVSRDNVAPPQRGSIPIDSEVAVSEPIAAALRNRYDKVVNTGVRVPPFTLTAGATGALADARAELRYSDGSVAFRAIDWNAQDVQRLASARPGSHVIRGIVRQRPYPRIFAYNRADPAIYRFERDGRVRYLFIATDDTDNNNVGSYHLPIRVADTIEALSNDKGGRSREVDLLNRHVRRDQTADGRTIAGCYWAPELHEIGGRLSILFAPCFNPKDPRSNEGGDWSTVQAHIMQLRPGGDPADPEAWSRPTAIRKADGSMLGRPEFDRNISLDMSYFDVGGQGYYLWSQRYLSPHGPPGDPLTWIAKVDPNRPDRLTSDPRPIIAPTLSFEENLAEGGFAMVRDGVVHVTYSGSGVSPTYVVGGVRASLASDLTNIANWRKHPLPLQKSVPMPSGVKDYLHYEQGPGHGAFTTDEDGNPLYVYHTWGDAVGGNGRDTRVRRIHWAADGRPILDMTADEEVAPALREVQATVLVKP